MCEAYRVGLEVRERSIKINWKLTLCQMSLAKANVVKCEQLQVV